MTTLAELCARTGLDRDAAQNAIGARVAHDDAPWYVQTVLGIGAWITVIAGLFFVWAVMEFVLEIHEPNEVIAIIGAVLFGVGFWLLHRKSGGVFTAHVATASCLAGTILVALGIGVPHDSLWIALVATLPFAAAAVWQQRSSLLQFLIVGVSLSLTVFAIWDQWDDVVSDLAAIAIPIGAGLLIYPPRLDVRPSAFALLLIPAVLETIALEAGAGVGFFHGWPAKLIFLALFGVLFFVNWRRLSHASKQSSALAGMVVAIAAAIVMPTGASAALVLLALAYTTGSRSLAVIGALGEAYFIWSFYSSMQETLLTKSIILMSVGAALLVCYGLALADARARRA